ncbi:MAG: hypothetical protein LBF15_03435 [Candidatus Peribacteria bacterium]|jgi:hypothetical protein|nr:hypothetical protein [Candidatus Peribacteria bacterium]
MNTLYIDNPTDTEVQVQINDNEVLTIAPNSHQEIKLGAGTYTLKID